MQGISLLKASSPSKLNRNIVLYLGNYFLADEEYKVAFNQPNILAFHNSLIIQTSVTLLGQDEVCHF